MTLTVSYLFDVERRMQIVANEEYQRLTSNIWYNAVAKHTPMTGKSIRFQWLMDTSGIQYVDALGGTQEFEELMMNTWEFSVKAASAGLVLDKYQFEDANGGGIDAAASWARQQAQYAAYWPQKQVAIAINQGGTNLCYDGLSYFNTAHPVNPFNTALGTYANVLTGSSAGAYPGACPIDLANAATDDVALENLFKAVNYINGGLTMPDGATPRFLRAAAVVVPTALTRRITTLLDSKFIAKAASSGGGSADVEAVISKMGLGQPIIAPELGSLFGGSDTDYYIAAETITSDPLGGIIWGDREPFSIVYNTGMTDAELQRANKLQWTNKGRNTTSYGHPFLLFKVRGT